MPAFPVGRQCRLALPIVAGITILASCQRQESQTTEPPPPVTPSLAASSRPKPGDVVDVHGISVRFLDGGTIELAGPDRWGAPLDTTYESIAFLRDALPALERSVTPEQAVGLRALIGR